MDTRSISILKKLNRRRRLVGRLLDKAYRGNDTLLYISLEERYKRLAQTIDRLLYQLRSRGHSVKHF